MLNKIILLCVLLGAGVNGCSTTSRPSRATVEPIEESEIFAAAETR